MKKNILFMFMLLLIFASSSVFAKDVILSIYDQKNHLDIDFSHLGIPEIKIYAKTRENLEKSLAAIPQDVRITHLYFSAHGIVTSDGDASLIALASDLRVLFAKSLNEASIKVQNPFTLEMAQKELKSNTIVVSSEEETPYVFTPDKTPASNPFQAIHHLFSSDLKIFFYTCYLFGGNEEQVRLRADLLRRFFAPLSKNVLIFGFTGMGAFPHGIHNRWMHYGFRYLIKITHWWQSRPSEDLVSTYEHMGMSGYRINANNELEKMLMHNALQYDFLATTKWQDMQDEL